MSEIKKLLEAIDDFHHISRPDLGPGEDDEEVFDVKTKRENPAWIDGREGAWEVWVGDTGGIDDDPPGRVIATVADHEDASILQRALCLLYSSL